MKSTPFGRLTILETDTSITISFADRIYVVDRSEPFYNIAKKAIDLDDMVPFYVEIARREGKGEAFRDQLLAEVERLKAQLDLED